MGVFYLLSASLLFLINRSNRHSLYGQSWFFSLPTNFNQLSVLLKNGIIHHNRLLGWSHECCLEAVFLSFFALAELMLLFCPKFIYNLDLEVEIVFMRHYFYWHQVVNSWISVYLIIQYSRWIAWSWQNITLPGMKLSSSAISCVFLVKAVLFWTYSVVGQFTFLFSLHTADDSWSAGRHWRRLKSVSAAVPANYSGSLPSLEQAPNCLDKNWPPLLSALPCWLSYDMCLTFHTTPAAKLRPKYRLFTLLAVALLTSGLLPPKILGTMQQFFFPPHI